MIVNGLEAVWTIICGHDDNLGEICDNKGYAVARNMKFNFFNWFEERMWLNLSKKERVERTQLICDKMMVDG